MVRRGVRVGALHDLPVPAPLELHEAAHQEVVARLERAEVEGVAQLLPLVLAVADHEPLRHRRPASVGRHADPGAVPEVLDEEAHLHLHAAVHRGHPGADAERVRVALRVADVDRRPLVLRGRSRVEGRGVAARQGAGGDHGGDGEREQGGDEWGTHTVHLHRGFATTIVAIFGSVMNRQERRMTRVHQAIAEPAPLAASEEQVDDFDALYRRTFPRVYAYAASLLRDRSAAEEVTAQAFERAYRKRRSYRPRRGTVEAWLFGIVRNAALDELRRRRRRADLEAEPADLASSDAQEQVEGAIRRETVRTALAALEPRDRELVALKFAGGLANAEIARVLGVSESNAGTRLHRALNKLREACHEDV